MNKEDIKTEIKEKIESLVKTNLNLTDDLYLLGINSLSIVKVLVILEETSKNHNLNINLNKLTSEKELSLKIIFNYFQLD